MKWGLLLHIYQPPNQRADILDLVAREGYLPLLDYLATVDVPITLNLTGVLTAQLVEHGQNEILAQLHTLWQKPNISFTTTAYTHALLPLWSDAVVADQLAQNRLAQQTALDPSFNETGLWLPECAYTPRLEAVLYQSGVRWTVIDESSLVGRRYYPAVRRPKGKLRLVVRNRGLSQALATSVEQFSDILTSLIEPAVVALDGEVFGHFDPHALDRLREVINLHGAELVSLESLAAGKLPRVSTRPSTWETSRLDQLRQIPFPLWRDRHNHIQREMWLFYQAAWRRLSETGSWQQDEWTRRHFTNAISSCFFWWANPKRTAGPFKMKIWNPDMVVEGLTEMIKAARTDPKLSPRAKWRLETQYADLLKRIWRQHWKFAA